MEHILNLLSEYGYLILALYSFGGGSIGIIGAGILASMGKLNIGYVILIGIIFNFLGDLFIFYYMSTFKAFFSGFIKKHRRKVAYSKLLLKKRGDLGMFIQKYIYLVKTIYPIILGIIGYNKKKFIVLNLLASIVWGVSLGLLSYFFSSAVQKLF